MRILFVTLSLLMACHGAWAIDLESAKDQGLVGESVTGMLAPVKAPPSAEVEALIRDVNKKRMARFKRAAERTDATLEQVTARFYQLAVEKTQRGHYYQDTAGNWRRK